jgi:hypothetical protein
MCLNPSFWSVRVLKGKRKERGIYQLISRRTCGLKPPYSSPPRRFTISSRPARWTSMLSVVPFALYFSR